MPHRARKTPAVPLALAGLVSVAGLLFGAGCGASRTFEGGVFRDGNIAFRVEEPPSAWKRIEMKGASLAFRDDERGATILVNARCGIDGDTPLIALTNHLLIGTTEREVDSQSTEAFDGREALHSVIRAKLDGVPMVFDLFVAKKDGCIYDFAEVSAGAGNRDHLPFERFVRSFHTLNGRGAS